jgi:two-component system response regulator HydG
METSVTLGNEFLALFDTESRPSVVILPDYTIAAVNKAFGTYFPAQGSVVGNTCYQVSHGYDKPCDQCGESCPISEVRKTRKSHKVIHVHQGPKGQEHVEIDILPVYNRSRKLVCFIETLDPLGGVSAEPAAEGMVGQSAVFNLLLDHISRVAGKTAAVLLLGETGTGKKLAAHAIHDLHGLSQRPFVDLKCTGLDEARFEGELFGYDKSMFAGAGHRKGLMDAAAGGTLFLDEIGDLSLTMQARLLRVLETGLFHRVGGIEPVRAEFRLLSATRRDLPSMVKEGVFREDLYYRINTLPIRLPALRDRMEDLPVLAESMLKRFAPQRKFVLSEQALDCLRAYAFPGNVRELCNMLEHACMLADSGVIQPEHLPEACSGHTQARALPGMPFENVVPLDQMEQQYLRWALGRLPGSRREQAEALGISERTLFRKLEELSA